MLHQHQQRYLKQCLLHYCYKAVCVVFRRRIGEVRAIPEESFLHVSQTYIICVFRFNKQLNIEFAALLGNAGQLVLALILRSQMITSYPKTHLHSVPRFLRSIGSRTDCHYPRLHEPKHIITTRNMLDVNVDSIYHGRKADFTRIQSSFWMFV